VDPILGENHGIRDSREIKWLSVRGVGRIPFIEVTPQRIRDRADGNCALEGVVPAVVEERPEVPDEDVRAEPANELLRNVLARAAPVQQ
jgi:hypothetical protein